MRSRANGSLIIFAYAAIGAFGCSGVEEQGDSTVSRNSALGSPSGKSPAQDTKEELLVLIEQLGSDKPAVRDAASKRLIQIGRTAIPELIALFNASDPELRLRAKYLCAMIELGPLKFSPTTLGAYPLLHDALAAGGAMEVLSRLTEWDAENDRWVYEVPEADLEKIVALLAKDDFATLSTMDKSYVIQLLSGLRLIPGEGTAVVVPSLLSLGPAIAKLLTDEDPSIREQAAIALGWTGANKFASQIVPCLGDKQSKVREAALFALERMGAVEYVKDVAVLLKDEVGTVRRSAVITLAKLGGGDHLAAIARLINDRDTGVCLNALSVLADLRSKEYAKDVATLLKDGREEVRARAAYTLGAMNARQYSQDVVQLLMDKQVRVQRSALDALERMEAAGDHLKEITPLLRHSLSIIRMQVAQLLGELRAKDFADDLVPLLKDEDPFVRAWAAIALVEVGKTSCVPREAAEDIYLEIHRGGDRRAEAALRALGVADEDIERAKSKSR